MDLLLTAGRLRALAPLAKPAIVDGLVAGQGVLAAYDINTPLRLWHFLAQVTHESAGLRTTVEYWGPTKAQRGYEGRADLGNTHTGDGIRFFGRGLLQLTGRANYRDYGRRLGLPLEDQPHLAADPATSLKIACEYWNGRGINAKADANDLEGVTRKINGGLNGLEDRRLYLTRARSIWPVEVLAIDRPTLRHNERGAAVEELQRLLGIKVNGKFGAGTERAVIAFQRARGMNADGVVGPKTWAALLAA